MSGPDTVLLVTGAAAGIGRGIAEHASERGDHVILVDIDETAVNIAVAALRAAGGSAEAHVVDVTNWAQMESLAGRVLEQHGRVDVLVNNAGVENHGLLWEVAPEHWERLIAINVTGTFLGVRAFVPHMVAADRPSCVVNVASTGGLGARPVMAPYMASKHAIMGLTESLDMEFRTFAPHVRAALFCPLTVRSNVFLSADTADLDGPGAEQRAAMQARNVRDGIDPRDAARMMFDGVDRGDLWIHTDVAASHRRVRERAAHFVRGERLPLP